MNIGTLQKILDIEHRDSFYRSILEFLKEFGKMEHYSYHEFDTNEGKMPILIFNSNLKPDSTKAIKLFMGAQHNEYNGLFGILEYLELIKAGKLSLEPVRQKNEKLIFSALTNPYGFNNPSKNNKSGYYLKNGTNLNRFWRRTFAPDYQKGDNDLNEHPIPEHCKVLKKLLDPYWKNEGIPIFIIDFHETSLLKRFSLELEEKFTNYYKFDHWLKEGIILNVMKLYEIPYYRKPLFFKCNPSADHTHINLSIKQADTVHACLKEYIEKNKGNLPFYFCYSDKSMNVCKKIARKVYEELKDILWDTYFPAFDHHFHDHGCFVKMSDATKRERVYSFEVESEKQFFDIFKEIEKSKAEPNYFEKKIEKLNLSLELARKTIDLVINLC